MNTYYIQTNLFCICMLVIIYFSLRNRNNTLPARRVAFNKLLFIIGLICVSDIFAWGFNGLPGAGNRAVIHISNMIYYGSITWAGYAWFNYVELRIKSLDYDFRKRRHIMAIPFLVMLLVIITNPLTEFLFSTDENNVYSRGSGVILHWLISWFYLVFATAEVFARIGKAKSRVEKEQFLPMIWFIVPPAVAAAVQMIFYSVTSTQCGMALAAMIITVNLMIEEVSKDSLTGLNNRRALEISIVERLQKSNAKYTFLMCDIDKFKTINDTLGHTAGDIVLKRMAEALKRVCMHERRSLILCRYGGDEFIICGIDLEKEETEALVGKIEACIAEVNSEYSNELSFGISVGQATGICARMEDAEALIRMADAMMYEVKQSKSVNRR